MPTNLAVTSKANASGLGGAVIGLLIATLESWPLFLHLPQNVQTSTESLLSALALWLIVYLSPPNAMKE